VNRVIQDTLSLDTEGTDWQIVSGSFIKMGRVRPKKRSDLSSRLIGGETVVLDRDGGQVHQMNATASYVWDRCDGATTETEIAQQLSEEYDVEASQAANDVAALVGQFQALGLLDQEQGNPI
jgi:PqqD family protein of HPr-rel-A system